MKLKSFDPFDFLFVQFEIEDVKVLPHVICVGRPGQWNDADENKGKGV